MNVLLQKFTSIENQTFLQNFYTTKIWSHTVAVGEIYFYNHRFNVVLTIV